MSDATFSSAAAAAPRSLAGYRRGLDLGRITVAFFIVWDHAHAPGWQIGYLALALFLFLTSFLAVQSYERRPGPDFWRKRCAGDPRHALAHGGHGQRLMVLGVAVLVRLLPGHL